MPQLMTQDDMQTIQIPGQGGFYFSAVRPEKLGATEYTLVTIVMDVTGSVEDFASELLVVQKTIVSACKKNPRAENLMLRALMFNDDVTEIHGFKPLSEIDPDAYLPFRPDGMTALFDAAFSAIGAAVEYGKVLTQQDFNVNAAVYTITDGDDNRSRTIPSRIAELVKKSKSGEELESLITILIGLQDPKKTGDRQAEVVMGKLEIFKKEAGLTQFVNVGDATPQRLAKLANWVSQSISSQSQSLGSGAASQPLNF